MVGQDHHRFSYAEYLARERETGLRHEFLDGQVFAMAGGTPEHARLIAEVTFALRQSLDPRRCRIFSADLRVRIPATGLATYPDVALVCGPVEVDHEDPNAVVNPSLLVEVLSEAKSGCTIGDWRACRPMCWSRPLPSASKPSCAPMPGS